MKSASTLSVELYDAAEAAAADRFPIRINQAFFPEMFATVGYPARVTRADQLWRYIDVMHETRTAYNMDYLLHGLTAREFELFKEVTRIVDSHASKSFGRRAHATAALLRAIHVLRLIKVVTGDERPAVLEVGPGCGYLGMLLLMEGYPYIGTDVAQAFYLYQNQMLSYVAKDLKEMVVEDGDVLSLDTPKPGTAIHIPWWKWVSLTPEQTRLSAEIMTCNHCLCEMHPNSMAYLAAISSHILANHPGGGKFVFDSWGYDLLHGESTVLAKFSEYGFRLCHNETAVSAMALTNSVKGWSVFGSTPAVNILSVPVIPSVERSAIVAAVNRVPAVKNILVSIINAVPGLKGVVSRLLSPMPNTTVAGQATAASPTPIGTKVPDFKAQNPLSRRLTDDRAAVAATAQIKLPEIEDFLKEHFNGSIPQHPDEAFYAVIRLTC